MAVSLFYGMTESGKTSLAKMLVGKISRSVVFDYNGNIELAGSFILNDFSSENISRIFSQFKERKKFIIVCRPPRNDKDEIVFSKVAILAIMLGRYQTQKGNKDRLILLIDEADMICKANYQPRELQYAINVGRHDFVDTWLIARQPQRIHTDARSNASTAFIFKLTDDAALQYIRRSFGGTKTTKAVMDLAQYSFLMWKATGEIKIFDKNQNLIESWS